MTEKRRSGVAFQIEQTYQYGQFKIPQSELYRLACKVNIADLVKHALAEQWVKAWMAQRQQASMQQQAEIVVAPQHVTTHHTGA